MGYTISFAWNFILMWTLLVLLLLAASTKAEDIISTAIASTTTTMNPNDSSWWTATGDDACAPHDDETSNYNRLGRYSALACWLQNLRIPLPNQSFREGIFTLSLKDFVCTNFSIAGLESAYEHEQPEDDLSMQNHTNPQLQVSLNNVSAVCQGTYHTSGLSGKVRATIGAHYANAPALQFAWTVQSAPLNHSFVQPVALNTADCQTDVAVTDLHFSGSISAKTIQIFVKQIRSSVTKALSTELCPLLASTLEPTFDHYFTLFNEWIEPYLGDDNDDESAPSRVASKIRVTQHVVPKDYSIGMDRPSWETNLETSTTRTVLERRHSPKKERLHWSRDAPALVGFLKVLNQGLDYFLNEGLLQHWLPIFDNRNKPHSCGFFFDGVNSLIRSVLYDNHGWVDLPLLSRWDHLHFVIPKYAAIRLQIKNVSVHGLDHFDGLELFSPSDESFVTRLDSHNVTFRTRLHLILSAVPDGVFNGDDLKENFVVDFNATTLNTMLRFQLDADKTALQQKVTIGTVCIDRFATTDLSAFWRIQSLSFQPDLNGTVTNSSPEQDLDHLINNALQILWSAYPDMVTQGVKGLMQGPVLNGLNEFFARVMSTNETCIPPNRKGYYPHLVDFTNVRWMRHMNDFFARSSTKRHIDSYLQCGADYITTALNERIPNSLVQVQKFAFENLGHLRELKLLSALPDGQSLSNSFDFGTDDQSALPSLDLKLKVDLPQISAVTNVTLKWNDIGASSGLTLHYDLGRLKQYPLSQVLEHGECAIVPTNELDLYGVTNKLGRFSIQFDAMVDYGGEPVFMNWTSNNTPEVEEVAMYVWAWAVNSSRDLLSLGSLATMFQASARCQGKDHAYDDEGPNEDYLSISLVVCAIILLAQPAVLMIHGENDNRRDFDRQVEEQEQYESALMQPGLTDANELAPSSQEHCTTKRSLIEHNKIPDVARIAIPVLIVCTIVLLLCSNLSVGADVELKASVAGQTFALPSVFSFSLYNTANEMLQARIYALLLLVAVFSGIWPYLKLCLMLYGWVRPFKNSKRRGRLFLALDALGKFSLVDTYVLVLMVVAFRYHLEIEGGVTLDVFVAPKFGFYGFLIATISSLMLSHALVFYHRRADLHLPTVTRQETSVLCNHSFQMQIGRKQLTVPAMTLAFAASVVTVVVLSIGITRESFVFEFGGVAGALIGTRKDAAYSLISIGQALPESVENSACLAIRGLQIAYFFFAVAAPFACILFLLLLFAFPLTLNRQLIILTCAEIANAWSAIEVFCLSIVAALFEISTFASFIVGDKCDLVDSILQSNFDQVADTCYNVKAAVSWNAAYLVFGVILNSALVSVALRFAHVALEEKLERMTPRPSHVDSLAAREVSFVECIAGIHGMSWLISSFAAHEGESEPLVDDTGIRTSLQKAEGEEGKCLL